MQKFLYVCKKYILLAVYLSTSSSEFHFIFSEFCYLEVCEGKRSQIVLNFKLFPAVECHRKAFSVGLSMALPVFLNKPGCKDVTCLPVLTVTPVFLRNFNRRSLRFTDASSQMP